MVHDILMHCMLVWRNKLECQGEDAARHLHTVKQEITEKYHESIATAVNPSQTTQGV